MRPNSAEKRSRARLDQQLAKTLDAHRETIMLAQARTLQPALSASEPTASPRPMDNTRSSSSTQIL